MNGKYWKMSTSLCMALAYCKSVGSKTLSFNPVINMTHTDQIAVDCNYNKRIRHSCNLLNELDQFILPPAKEIART